ncbi:protein TIFY 8 isoform X2 [Syzygium oleosum]|uniref:protein TIFY 8 isoform X2 n=1 Tax=Syzygium oleosum TaxID=219896 RepID=UPI0024B91E30|nr:protein TIFY 8 isoform X2 [Syzygium oleosum]
MAVSVKMAQTNKPHIAGNGGGNSEAPLQQQQQEVKPMFHDFLGMKKPDSPAAAAAAAGGRGGDARPSEAASPAASLSVGASSGGGRGPISTTSDLGSERQVSNHFEGVPYYVPRSEAEISRRLAGSKRSASDSAFIGSTREAMTQRGPDSNENLHLMKILRNGAGGERPRRSNEEEVLLGVQPLRQSSGSLILHPGSSSRNEATVSKWERPMPMNLGPAVQFAPRGGQYVPFVHNVPPNRFREVHPSPPVLSQSAADEGSRTGIKGPGILSSMTAGTSSEKNLSAMPPSGNRAKTATLITEPESFNPPSRPGLTSESRQMTIFYCGQAHVFDDVHPNKADVIMALAGSNGGSWSTMYSPKSGTRPTNESNVLTGENKASVSFSRDFHGKSPATADSSHGTGSGNRISNPSGGPRGHLIVKDPRKPLQVAERIAEEKVDP